MKKKLNKLLVRSRKTILVLLSAIILLIILLYNLGKDVPYVSHQTPVETSDTFANTPNHPLTTPHTHNICYETSYLRNIFTLTVLDTDFFRGHDIYLGILSALSVDFSDQYLNDYIAFLAKIINPDNSAKLNIHYLQSSFDQTRSLIMQQYCANSFLHSKFLNFFAKSMCFYKQGDKALETTGVEKTIEEARRKLAKYDIEGAFHLISTLEPEYLEIAAPWLQTTDSFLKVYTAFMAMRIYIHSPTYSNQFMRECN